MTRYGKSGNSIFTGPKICWPGLFCNSLGIYDTVTKREMRPLPPFPKGGLGGI